MAPLPSNSSVISRVSLKRGPRTVDKHDVRPPTGVRTELDGGGACMLKKVNSEQGFTLSELLIVVAILGVLVAAVLPNFVGAATR